MPTHKRNARGPSKVRDTDQIVATATAILDQYGIGDLTMRRLARELEVTAGALYWHFENKQQLLGAVADAVLAPADVADAAETDWPTAISNTCVRLREALLAHTDGAELVSASLAAGQSTVMNTIRGRLGTAAAAAGMVEPDADLAARTVLYYVLGFTADEQSRRQWDAVGAAVPAGPEATDPDPGSRFMFGLELLLAGLSVRAQAVHQKTAAGR